MFEKLERLLHIIYAGRVNKYLNLTYYIRIHDFNFKKRMNLINNNSFLIVVNMQNVNYKKVQFGL